MDGWRKFSSGIKNLKVSNLSVRNLNVVNIPLLKFDLEDYFRLASNLPGQLKDNTLTNFFFNISIAFPEHKAFCDVTMSPQASGRGVSIILDIHAHKGFMAQEDIQTELEALKVIKDKVFFSIVTENCKEMFR
jgi:uncharacterized protein (TIGR04255 family)